MGLRMWFLGSLVVIDALRTLQFLTVVSVSLSFEFFTSSVWLLKKILYSKFDDIIQGMKSKLVVVCDEMLTK